MSANSHPPNSKNVLCNAAAGAAAGVVAATFVCPLDVIKTRFQVHGLPKLGDANIKGSLIVGSLEQIFKREGMRGLYRGLSPTVMALLSNWAIYFTMYDQLKSFLCSNGLCFSTQNLVNSCLSGGFCDPLTQTFFSICN
jgi:solute carrier family 25 folate transporter 32